MRPHLTMDDGCDLVTALHTGARSCSADVLAGTEETTTGVIRLRAMAGRRRAAASRSSPSTTPTPSTSSTTATAPASRTLDGIIRATNILLAGSTFVVGGYGWCGEGSPSRAGHGRQRDRHRGRPDCGARGGDGRLPGDADGRGGGRWATSSSPSPATSDVLRGEHFEAMKDGAILANSGHFDVEIDLPALEQQSVGKPRGPPPRRASTCMRRRPPPLPARRGPAGEPGRRRGPSRRGDGHELRQPGAVGRVGRASTHAELAAGSTTSRPRSTARSRGSSSTSMGVEIDTLTPEQAKYLSSWDEGT